MNDGFVDRESISSCCALLIKFTNIFQGKIVSLDLHTEFLIFGENSLVFVEKA